MHGAVLSWDRSAPLCSQSCARLTDLAASASAAAYTGWDLQQHTRRGGGGRCPGPGWGSWTLELCCRWSLQLCPSLLGWASCPCLVTVPQAVCGTCPHQPCCAAGTPSSWLCTEQPRSHCCPAPDVVLRVYQHANPIIPCLDPQPGCFALPVPLHIPSLYLPRVAGLLAFGVFCDKQVVFCLGVVSQAEKRMRMQSLGAGTRN